MRTKTHAQSVPQRQVKPSAPRRPSASDRAAAEDQETIDDEVLQFLDDMAYRSIALCRRTNKPMELVRSHLTGAAMLVAQFLSEPTADELEELEISMRGLRMNSGNVLYGDIVRALKRPRIRKAAPQNTGLTARRPKARLQEEHADG